MFFSVNLASQPSLMGKPKGRARVRRRGQRQLTNKAKNYERKRLQKQKNQLSLDIPQANVHSYSCRGAPIGLNVNTAEKQQLGTFEKVKHAASTELGWSVTANDEVLHCNMHRIPTTRGPTETPKCIAINADLTWACFIHGSRVPLSCDVIETFPDELEHQHLHPLLETVRLASVCTGNQDPEYTKMAEVRGGKFISTKNKVVAFLDNKAEILTPEGEVFDKTVRSAECTLLCTNGQTRCCQCQKHRQTLRAIASYEKRKKSDHDRTAHNSKCNYRHLNKEELTQRLNKVQREKRTTATKLERLLQEAIERDGIHLNQEDSEEVSKMSSEVETKFQEGSFQRIFWAQQMQYLRLKDKRAMKWHPAIIKFALNLRYVSSAAYRAVKSNGHISLPSERTLRDYTHWLPGKDGVQLEVLQHIKEQMNFDSLPSWKRNVVLLMDEVHIKSDLVFKKLTGELVGFVNLGDVNHDLQKMVDGLSSDQSAPPTPQLAKQMFVFMMRSIFQPNQFHPVAHYPTLGAHGEEIFPLAWDVIQKLETHGFKVRCITSDGASPNRKFYHMHRLPGSTDTPIFSTPNPYSEDKRKLYFVCDVPHLLKTTRNCFSNSFAHSKTRCLQVS